MENGVGEHTKIVSNSCRDSCSIKAYKQPNDDTEMKEFLDSINADHEAWKMKMAAHAKKVSEKETALKQFDLRKASYRFVEDLSITSVVSIEIVNRGFPKGIKLTRGARLCTRRLIPT